MAKKENITLSIDSELKAQAEALFTSLGMDISRATSIFYRQVLRYNGMPFEFNFDEPNETTIAAIKAVENNEGMYGPFNSVEELMKSLNADD